MPSSSEFLTISFKINSAIGERHILPWQKNRWFFSVLDIIGATNEQDDYPKNRNYWKYLKAKLKKEGNEVVSATTQLKLLAPDGKHRLSDAIDQPGVIALAKAIPNNKATAFLDWFTYSDNSIDGHNDLYFTNTFCFK